MVCNNAIGRLGGKGKEMNRFVEFNPVKFLNESREWQRRRRAIEVKIDSVSLIKSSSLGAVAKTNIKSDTVEAPAIKIMELEEEVADIDKYIKAKDWALSKLTEQEREVINGFFFRCERIDKFVRDYGRKYGMCRSDVYTARRLALDRLSEIICERFGI